MRSCLGTGKLVHLHQELVSSHEAGGDNEALFTRVNERLLCVSKVRGGIVGISNVVGSVHWTEHMLHISRRVSAADAVVRSEIQCWPENALSQSRRVVMRPLALNHT